MPLVSSAAAWQYRRVSLMQITPLASNREAEECASMMASTSPWLTLGRTFADCLANVCQPDREVHVARAGDAIAGFIILSMRGAFPGYIQTICVAESARSHGVGSQLMRFAEERIFREHANAFICVSSFNPRARQLYERLGYRAVGELEDYLVRGHSEIFMRKSIGPIDEFRKRKAPSS